MKKIIYWRIKIGINRALSILKCSVVLCVLFRILWLPLHIVSFYYEQKH